MHFVCQKKFQDKIHPSTIFDAEMTIVAQQEAKILYSLFQWFSAMFDSVQSATALSLLVFASSSSNEIQFNNKFICLCFCFSLFVYFSLCNV